MSGVSWDLLHERVARVQELLDVAVEAPRHRAIVDQDGAHLRDELDQYGVTLADADTLFVGLVFVEVFLRRFERHATTRGLAVAAHTARCVRNGLIAAAIEHIPVEARRG